MLLYAFAAARVGFRVHTTCDSKRRALAPATSLHTWQELAPIMDSPSVSP